MLGEARVEVRPLLIGMEYPIPASMGSPCDGRGESPCGSPCDDRGDGRGDNP